MEKSNMETPLKGHMTLIKGLENVDIDCLYGVNYFKFSKKYNIKDLVQLARKLNIRSDDVLTVGFPRSGNHWTFEVVTMILNQTTNINKDNFHTRIIDYLGGEMASNIENIDSPRILSTHYRMDKIPEQVIQKGVKVIYIIRNPKDVLVSFYNLFIHSSRDELRFKGSWEEFFDLEMRGEFPYGYWFDHILTTETFLAENPSAPVYILQYEKMKANPIEEIKKLCVFLNKPESLAQQIAEQTEFSQMKSQVVKTKQLSEVDKILQNGINDFLRKGVIGDWKKWFNVAQNEAFNSLFDEKMGGSELGNLVREYIQ